MYTVQVMTPHHHWNTFAIVATKAQAITLKQMAKELNFQTRILKPRMGKDHA
jgi:hypothetical protein